MSRCYHLWNPIRLDFIIKNTDLSPIFLPKGYKCICLFDNNNNQCLINESVVYACNIDIRMITVRNLNFRGRSSELDILMELHTKLGILFYDDTLAECCFHESRSIHINDITEWMSDYMGIELQNDE